MYSSPEVTVYDARGNGDGKTTNAIVGGHEDRVTDYTTIIVLATQQGGAEITTNISPTITAAAGMSGNNQPVICLQGNGIDRADTAGCNGKGWNDAGVCYTLNTIDRPAVAYCIGNGQVHDAVQMEREKCKTLNCMDDPMKVLIRKV